MSNQVTELFFLNHLAPRFNLPVPEHLTADASGSEIRNALKRWNSKAIIKPDLPFGKRGKAGVIYQVNEYVEAQRVLKSLQGKEINGRLPRTAYMVQYIPCKLEMYMAITYDSRYLSPALTVSLTGGVEVESIADDKKVTVPVDVYKGVGAYQASDILTQLNCPPAYVSTISRMLVDFWDMFSSTGMQMCEVNPCRITPEGKPYICDFKAVFDDANFKYKNLGVTLYEYPAHQTFFEEEMSSWSASSHRGQAHVADLGGKSILPILFGGGASTIIVETLLQNGGDPIFLSDFGGNPPYERMFGTARICFEHNLDKAKLLLILGGKANNTAIDITFKAIGDALQNYVDEHGPITIPVVVGRGGPQLLRGLLSLKDTLESLHLPYVIFGPDTPITMVAEYAAKLANVVEEMGVKK